MNPPPVALVTGASSGIGAEFARQLSSRGYHLILTARRLDRLQQLAATLPHAETLPADLALPADRARVAAVLRDHPRLALLVNNAGFGTKGLFWNAPLPTQQQMHQLHVDATYELTHAALANLTQRPAGGVINVASVAGFFRSPSNVSYCATKAWMIAFSEALELELRAAQSPIRVQALCPGFTYTEFHDTMGVSRDRVAKHLWMSAEFVVSRSLRDFDNRVPISIPGWKYRLLVALGRRLPHSLLMRLQQHSPHTKGRI